MGGPDLAQPHQCMLRPEYLPHIAQSWLISELTRQKRCQGQQRHPHRSQPLSHPAHGPGQLDVWPNPFRRFLDALTCRHLGLYDDHYLPDLVEASWEPLARISSCHFTVWATSVARRLASVIMGSPAMASR